MSDKVRSGHLPNKPYPFIFIIMKNGVQIGALHSEDNSLLSIPTNHKYIPDGLEDEPIVKTIDISLDIGFMEMKGSNETFYWDAVIACSALHFTCTWDKLPGNLLTSIYRHININGDDRDTPLFARTILSCLANYLSPEKQGHILHQIVIAQASSILMQEEPVYINTIIKPDKYDILHIIQRQL